MPAHRRPGPVDLPPEIDPDRPRTAVAAHVLPPDEADAPDARATRSVPTGARRIIGRLRAARDNTGVSAR